MMKQSNDKDLLLYRAVDEILHYLWDPIGISGIPEARDEYCSYIPLVISVLGGPSDVGEVAKMLCRIESERMGLTPNNDHCIEVAKVLFDWYGYFGNQHE